jgi:hypothetical protein
MHAKRADEYWRLRKLHERIVAVCEAQRELPEEIAVPQQEYVKAKDNLAKLIRTEYHPAAKDAHAKERYWQVRGQYERWIAKYEEAQRAVPEGSVAASQQDGECNNSKGAGREGVLMPSKEDNTRREGILTLSGGDKLGGFSQSSEKSESAGLSWSSAGSPKSATRSGMHGGQFSDGGMPLVARSDTAMSSPKDSLPQQIPVAQLTSPLVFDARSKPLPSLPNMTATQMPLPPPKNREEVVQQWHFVAWSMLGVILGFAMCYYTLVPSQRTQRAGMEG